jgi:hypothetical protein
MSTSLAAVKLPLKFASWPLLTLPPEHSFCGHCPFKYSSLLLEVGMLANGVALMGALAAAAFFCFFSAAVCAAVVFVLTVADEDEDDDDNVDALFFVAFPCHGA